MTRKPEIDETRRLLVAASAGLLLPRWMRADSQTLPVLRWKFEEKGDLAMESVGKTQDAIASRTGHAIWAGSGRNRALRFDGYSVWLRHNAAPGIFRGSAVTITAWVAVESYPVNEAALLQMDNKSSTIFRFSIDRLGFLQFGHHPADPDTVCRSSGQVPKGRWVHVAAVAGESGITLYQDGAPCGHSGSGGKVKLPESANFVLGGSPDCTMAAEVFPTGIFNGLMRDVCVFDSERSRQAIAGILEEGKPDGPPDLQRNGAWCVSDPQRPIAHAQPPRAWTNEPHGLIRFRDQYHLFYQKNPNGPYWGHIQWGHMTSPDLLRWTEQPVALSPQPGFSREGIWSGSAIVHDGKLALLYTGVDGVRAGIAVAFSNDGINFTSHPGNPVIPHPPMWGDFLDFRDPFVWREGETYYLIVGSGVKDVGGTALLYRSKDLLTWEYRKQIYSGRERNSGSFWEMPIFVNHGDLHALIVSELPGRGSYWVGSWKDETFTPLSGSPRRLELFNHLLSPTPMIGEDGEIVVMGIIPDERPPKELSAAGWAHLYSLPRSLSIDPSGLVVQKPHASVDPLCHRLESVSDIEPGNGPVQVLPNISETSLRFRGTFRRGNSRSVSLLVRRSPDGQEQTEIHYDWEHARLILDRTKSSLDPLPKRDRLETDYTTTEPDSLHLDVFVDRSVLEVFVDGRASFAARIYPKLNNSDGIGFASMGPGQRWKASVWTVSNCPFRVVGRENRREGNREKQQGAGMNLNKYRRSHSTQALPARPAPAMRRTIGGGKPRRCSRSRFTGVLALAIAFWAVAATSAVAKDKEKQTGDWKPRIHFYAGPAWNNDPNGPILLNGVYHLFYQNNPYGDQWGHMSWGHAASRDLVHWGKFPVALLEADGVMNFSGSVVEDPRNTSGFCGESPKGASTCLVAVYTGDSKPSGAERQNQNLAYSHDGGMTWTRYNKNPVLDFMLKDFRDPKVFWHEPSQSWIMVVMLADQRVVQIFRSPDLKHWKAASKFGPAGAIGGFWECPDLMELDVRDSQGNRVGSRWVLSVNLNPGGVAGGSGNQYFVGQFDGTRFTEDHPKSGIHWVDWGKDFYASTSFANIPAHENRLWLAWMGNWQYADTVPALPGRGEMTLARHIYLRHEDPQNSASPLVLVQEPVLPSTANPAATETAIAPVTIAEANARFGGKEPGDSVYALRATFDPGASTEVGVRLRRSSLKPEDAAQEETVVGIDRAKGQIFVDRKRSGYVSFSPDFSARTVAPLKHPEAKTINLNIVIDRNSIEVFAEDGETVLTNLIYPSDASQGLAFYTAGAPAGGEPARVLNLDVVPVQ